MEEHPQENPSEKSLWRKKILEKIAGDLKKTTEGKNVLKIGRGEIIFGNDKEHPYCFLDDQHVLKIDREGNLEKTIHFSDNRLMTADIKSAKSMAEALDEALAEYAKKHKIKTDASAEDDETYGMAVDTEKPKTAEDEQKRVRSSIIGKIIPW